MIQTLTEFDPLLKPTLWTGKWKSHDGEKVALLKSVEFGETKKYHFEIREENSLQVPSFGQRLLLSIRPFSLTATATPGLVVLSTGILIEGLKPNFNLFFLSLFSVVSLQSSVNLLNDVYDHLKGIDLPGDLGGSGMIQKGWLSARKLFLFAVIAFCIALTLGFLPLLYSWKDVWWIGVLGIIGGLGYSGLGIGFKYRALGDLFVFLLCGPILAMGFSLVTFGTTRSSFFYSGLVFGFAALGILHANNLNDLEIDQTRGARTIANVIGFKRSQKYFSLIYFTIFALGLIATLTQRVPLWYSMAPILICSTLYQTIQKVKRAAGPLSPSIAFIRFEAAKIHLLIGGCFMIVLIISALVKRALLIV